MNEENRNEILEELRKIRYLATFAIVTKDLEFTEEQKIEILNKCDYTQREIAEFLGIDQSTVSRRLKPKGKTEKHE